MKNDICFEKYLSELDKIEIPVLDKNIVNKINKENLKLNIFTDGASKGNPG